MYEEHEEKGTVVLSCDRCFSRSHGPAVTALTQEVSNQVQFLCLLKISNCAFSENISTADYKVFWDGALFIPPGEAVFSPAVIKIFIDPKGGGHNTLGPKFLGTFDKKQGPGSRSAQASSSPTCLSWCNHHSCMESRTEAFPVKVFMWSHFLTY